MLKGLVLLKEGGLTAVRILCFSGQNTVIPYCCLILPIPHPFLLFRLDCIFLYLSNQFPCFLSFCYMLSFRRSYSLPPDYAHFFACQKTGTLNVVTPLPRLFHIPQFSSVAQSCPTLCDAMNCSMPGLPVHHQLPETTQTHVH